LGHQVAVPALEAPLTPVPSLDRFRGNNGTIIDPHRSLATLRLRSSDVLVAIVLGVGMSAGFVASLGWVGRGWTWAFERMAAPLGFTAGVSGTAFTVGSFVQFQIPHFNVTALPPSSMLWWVTLIVTVVVVAVSFLFRDAFLPLAYALRLAAAVQATALIFFRFAPWPFPYELGGYVTGMLLAGATVIGLVPIVLGLTYHVIDVTFLQKVGLSLAIMGHLLLFVPLQYALQSAVVAYGSLLFLPLSFILFGLLPEIMIFIALYGWGMSWTVREPRGRRQ
jgi:hypothetical protein